LDLSKARDLNLWRILKQLFNARCDQLGSLTTQNQTYAEQLMQVVLNEAFSHHSEAEAADPALKATPHA
jgi:hypothetical protein